MSGKATPSPWPLVGRDAELGAFASAWAGRRCRGVVVFGPAGVGKSRLAQECLATAVREGWKAARVTASAAAAAVPLGAFAHLIPAGVDLSDPVEGFSAATRALAGPQRDRRWAVWVDDLHLLDAASAVLLRQLMVAGVVRLIGTVRSGEPVGDAVDALVRDGAVHRIDLAPFDLPQVEQMLHAALGRPVGNRTLHELHTVSGGNVLYLRELVLGALEAGTLTGDGEIWQLAEGALAATPKLAELVGARLNAAGPAARPVLELLALCEPLPLADAQAVSGREVLARLRAGALVQVLTHRHRTLLALAHPLHGEVLRAGLPALRRRGLLLAQAERTRAHGARRREDTLRLATWQLAATGTADPALLVQAAALARHAHDYRQVTALLEAVPEADRTYASCLLHGEALGQLGQWQQADVLLAGAEERAGEEGERVAATLARTWNLFWTGRFDEALQVDDAALKQITDPAHRQVLTLNEASMRTISGQPAQGLTLLDALETDVLEAPDAGLWALAALCKSAGLTFVGRSDEAIAWAEHAHAALKAGPQEIGPHPAVQLNPLIHALADAGQLARARGTAERVIADTVAVDVALAWPGVYATHFLGRVEWLAGDVAAARRWYAEAIAQARAAHVPRLLLHAWAGLAASAAVLGDVEAAGAALAEMGSCPPADHFAGEEALGQAWLHAAHGHLAQARKVLTGAAARARATGHATSEMLLLTDIARLGGARQVTARLTALARSCDGAFAPARAHLAAGLAADDPARLLAAAGELRTIGAHLLAAEAATAAAAAWQRAGQQRRAGTATELARAAAARCPGARTPLLTPAEATSALTAREREVALLAAAGTSSRDIAEALHLSVRTVDNHLQRAYAKLGVTTRRELARTFG